MRLNDQQPDEPVEVLAERFRIEQVIINLLRNAVDATRKVKEPQIDVILTQGDNVSLAVCDNGPGIADLDALFEPFYTTKGAATGLGLGLAILKSGIVGDLGGRLTARNRPKAVRCSRWSCPLRRGQHRGGMSLRDPVAGRAAE